MTRANMLLAICLVLTSLWLVSARYESRRLVVSIENLEKSTVKIQNENIKLQINQEETVRHAKVSVDAHVRLGMKLPAHTLFLESEVKYAHG